MQTLTLHLPDSLDLDASELTMILATQLYGRGDLSMGQAAEMTGHTKRTFMELLGSYGVAIFNLTEEELRRDVENA